MICPSQHRKHLLNLCPLLLLGLLGSCTTPHQLTSYKAKTIVVVLAHPDDETVLGGALARLARDARVHLLIATDGRNGVTAHAKIPAGDALAAKRAKEAECSSQHLGLASVQILGAHDGFGMHTGTPEYFSQMRRVRKVLINALETLRPDMIITFGPDGDTGHADHRIISALVTEIRLQGLPTSQPDFFYAAWSAEQAASYKGWGLSHVAAEYIDANISFTPEDESKSLDSIRCYA